ncbi:MAG: biopolymer transporter ExbD [Candidatus Omnitrophica bacterium]|nr:biopolymer transporter ExbD [Candidatus Omnitrophota bacterium]
MSKRPRIEMVPLIDCFFLLLVFFIFGVFSMTMQQGSAPGSQPSDKRLGRHQRRPRGPSRPGHVSAG